MITIRKIDEMFSNMNTNGLKTDTPMLYGYFFTNDNQKQLEKVAEELKEKKFEFVEIYQDEDKLYWLHLERKEVHNSKTLFALNKELYAISDKYKLNSYDGFDLGNVDKTKSIDQDTYVVPEEFKATNFMKDGYPMLLVGNTAFDRFLHKDEFYYFIKITMHYKTNVNGMLPSEKDLIKLDKFDYFIEDEFVKQKLKSYYVFRDTYKGSRRVFMATNNKNLANNILTEVLKNKKTFPFEFEIVNDKEWKLYENVKPKFPEE